MEKNVTILVLLALAAAPQPLFAQAPRPAQKPATTQTKPAPTAKPAPPAKPAPTTPYVPEFVIPAQGDDSGQAPSTANIYKIGLNDEIKITVFDEPDLSMMYRVDADGSLSFPFIGRVQAAGTTLAELQRRITTMLAAGYIKNPQVRVEINQYKSQFVYVIGEVRAPGKITMTGTRMTLLEALALAGSPTANASNEVIVVHPLRAETDPRKAGAESEGTRISVNRKDLELGKAGQDVVLQDGDIINVPSAQHFYITGMVRNPGTYVLDPGITVQQAIGVAGGLNDRGSDRRLKISRLVNGRLTELSVDLEDKLQAGDTLMISGRFF